MKDLEYKIFNIQSSEQFVETALEIFHFQIDKCEVYRAYIYHLGIDFQKVNSIEEIPFLPIGFFKSHMVKSGNFKEEKTFLSSGTTGLSRSNHFVKDLSLYKKSFQKSFEIFYGPISDYCILALLPSYPEQERSSLIFMVDDMIKQCKHPDSGFFMNNHGELADKLTKPEKPGQKTLLIGVSFALLDFADKHCIELRNTIIMETGGMKGRRKEMVREELHDILSKQFSTNNIHSEYSMTELLSQAYSSGKGIFKLPPWMKILIRDTYDPFKYLSNNKSGGINIIDLANIYTCSFIETNDIGKIFNDGSFSILGRFDNTDIRGCNLVAY